MALVALASDIAGVQRGLVSEHLGDGPVDSFYLQQIPEDVKDAKGAIAACKQGQRNAEALTVEPDTTLVG
jgi:hypothetical protein